MIGSTSPRIVSVQLQITAYLVVQVFIFTYACDDQLSCSLHTPKMGAVVETWHKHQPLILGMHRYTSSVIACFLVKAYPGSSKSCLTETIGRYYLSGVLSISISPQSIVTSFDLVLGSILRRG